MKVSIIAIISVLYCVLSSTHATIPDMFSMLPFSGRVQINDQQFTIGRNGGAAAPPLQRPLPPPIASSNRIQTPAATLVSSNAIRTENSRIPFPPAFPSSSVNIVSGGRTARVLPFPMGMPQQFFSQTTFSQQSLPNNRNSVPPMSSLPIVRSQSPSVSMLTQTFSPQARPFNPRNPSSRPFMPPRDNVGQTAVNNNLVSQTPQFRQNDVMPSITLLSPNMPIRSNRQLNSAPLNVIQPNFFQTRERPPQQELPPSFNNVNNVVNRLPEDNPDDWRSASGLISSSSERQEKSITRLTNETRLKESSSHIIPFPPIKWPERSVILTESISPTTLPPLNEVTLKDIITENPNLLRQSNVRINIAPIDASNIRPLLQTAEIPESSPVSPNPIPVIFTNLGAESPQPTQTSRPLIDTNFDVQESPEHFIAEERQENESTESDENFEETPESPPLEDNTEDSDSSESPELRQLPAIENTTEISLDGLRKFTPTVFRTTERAETNAESDDESDADERTPFTPSTPSQTGQQASHQLSTDQVVPPLFSDFEANSRSEERNEDVNKVMQSIMALDPNRNEQLLSTFVSRISNSTVNMRSEPIKLDTGRRQQQVITFHELPPQFSEEVRTINVTIS